MCVCAPLFRCVCVSFRVSVDVEEVCVCVYVLLLKWGRCVCHVVLSSFVNDCYFFISINQAIICSASKDTTEVLLLWCAFVFRPRSWLLQCLACCQ